jgi:hypothetical protein
MTMIAREASTCHAIVAIAVALDSDGDSSSNVRRVLPRTEKRKENFSAIIKLVETRRVKRAFHRSLGSAQPELTETRGT